MWNYVKQGSAWDNSKTRKFCTETRASYPPIWTHEITQLNYINFEQYVICVAFQRIISFGKSCNTSTHWGWVLKRGYLPVAHGLPRCHATSTVQAVLARHETRCDELLEVRKSAADFWPRTSQYLPNLLTNCISYKSSDRWPTYHRFVIQARVASLRFFRSGAGSQVPQ